MLWNLTKKLGSRKQDSELSYKNTVEAKAAVVEQDSEKQLDEMLNIKEDKIIIQFTGASPASEGLLVGFFISNGFSRKITCTNVSLILMDSNKRVLARQTFDGDTIGEVNSRSEKACVARFLPKNVFVSKLPSDSQLCFDLS
ncbi:SLAP domain-containing protein [Desulfosporosinus sp. OT]|uniref:SLAP domain-containing protein n=1 Tax=Desulfosporosinus sp. OT TaxID=913865 RepID=UPI000223A13E|nr:SLAP domain-containing protein [Desulfosporosinus sp. OT]EGW39899.1 hypothetical protein DOT_2099 [Desulfosporosinus sp. OT]